MKKIIFVSRLDSDCSLGAHLLCEISLKLAKIYPDLQIVIVGGGSEYEKIHLKVQKINAVFSRELIVTVGETQSPCKYFTRNSIFVGVSRAALEAMAHGLPVILVGNEGYIGLLNEKNLKRAKETNFTCRGRNTNMSKTNLAASLYNDICYFFSLPPKAKEELYSLSREITKKEYSAQDMAIKTFKFYQKTINEYKKLSLSPKIAICGYYGKGNLGDEAILSIIKSKIKKATPNSQINTLNTKNPISILKALYKTDLFIFGGGSLLQNSTSNASLFYYLLIIRVAKLLCKRTIMLANGIGPIKNRLFSKAILDKATKSTINTLDYISTRDIQSQKYLLNLLPNRKIYLIPDPALLYSKNINPELRTSGKKEYFVFIPCTNAIKNNNISIKKLANLLIKAEKILNLPLAILVLNPKEDLKLANFIKSYCPSSQILCPKNTNELLALIKKSQIAISQRYHGTLFSSICKIPTISVSDDPKMSGLCNELLLFPSQSLKSFLNFEELANSISSAISHYNKNIDIITKRIDEYAQRSNSQLEIILSKFIPTP
jgi:polysaccharide pyruvyl transferase CsaB